MLKFLFVVLVLFTSIFNLESAIGAEKAPLEVQVYRNHSLDDESIIKMSGIDQDPSLSALEVHEFVFNHCRHARCEFHANHRR